MPADEPAFCFLHISLTAVYIISFHPGKFPRCKDTTPDKNMFLSSQADLFPNCLFHSLSALQPATECEIIRSSICAYQLLFGYAGYRQCTPSGYPFKWHWTSDNLHCCRLPGQTARWVPSAGCLVFSVAATAYCSRRI